MRQDCFGNNHGGPPRRFRYRPSPYDSIPTTRLKSFTSNRGGVDNGTHMSPRPMVTPSAHDALVLPDQIWLGDSQFGTIDWQIIKNVRKRCTRTQQTKTSKIMHNWLPVMHMLSHMTGNSQCPGCLCTDETLDHIFHCPHIAMETARDSVLTDLHRKGIKRRVPRAFFDMITTMLKDYFTHSQSPPPHTPAMGMALHSQQTILTKPKICTAVHIFLENILEHPRPSENIIYIFSLNNILCVRYTYYFVRQ